MLEKQTGSASPTNPSSKKQEKSVVEKPARVAGARNFQSQPGRQQGHQRFGGQVEVPAAKTDVY